MEEKSQIFSLISDFCMPLYVFLQTSKVYEALGKYEEGEVFFHFYCLLFYLYSFALDSPLAKLDRYETASKHVCICINMYKHIMSWSYSFLQVY